MPAPTVSSQLVPSRRELTVLVALLGLALLCYASIIPTYFLSDDFCFVDLAERSGMYLGWAGFVRPGTVLTYLIDHALWGFNSVGYHLTNVLFHGLAAFAVYLFARYFFVRVKLAHPHALSILAACLFVALPSHSESVSWISGRTDVIAVALGLAATCCFLYAHVKRSVLFGGLALALLAAALLTKESVIVVPLIWAAILASEWWWQKTAPARQSGLLLVLSFLLLAGYFVFRKAVIGEFIGGYSTAVHLAIFQRSSLEHLSDYALRTFLPASVRLYQATEQPLFPLAAGFAGAVLVSVLVLSWLRSRTIRWSLIALLIACYLMSLVPVITIPISLIDTQSERFLYFPSVFACLLVVYLAASCIPKVRFQTAAVVLLIAVEAAALQWVNQRWITASFLSKEIAAEVSRTDPKSTLILNIPDNFRGAYVFRNCIHEAATVFMGNKGGGPYIPIIVHDTNSMDEVFQAKSDGRSATLMLPDDRGYFVHNTAFKVDRQSGALVVTSSAGLNPEHRLFLSFRTAATRPMLTPVTSTETIDGTANLALPALGP